MSEFINNVTKPKDATKEIIRLLHQGRTVEELQAEDGHIIAVASAQDIAAAEPASQSSQADERRVDKPCLRLVFPLRKNFPQRVVLRLPTPRTRNRN